MRRRRIGSGGFEVGAIGLGCSPLSGTHGAVDTDAAVEVIDRALDLGVSLLDTADVYGPFTNELLVGRAIRGRRDQVVIASKCGQVPTPDSQALVRDGRPEHIRRACDASLRRLGVDRIDLYQLHRVDPKVPLEETWGAMAELVKAGKVRAIGLSGVGVAELQRAQHVFPVTTVQNELLLWTREPLAEVLPWCRAHGVGFLACRPLGRGYLTGALGPDREPGPDDSRSPEQRFTPETTRAAIVAGIRRVAERHGAVPAQVALAWVLAQGAQVVPIPGTRQVAHLEENVAAVDLRLTDEDLAELDALPKPAGSR